MEIFSGPHANLFLNSDLSRDLKMQFIELYMQNNVRGMTVSMVGQFVGQPAPAYVASYTDCPVSCFVFWVI